LEQADDPILRALGYNTMGLDVLQIRLGWATAPLQARLLELELEGLVVRLPGGLYQRRAWA
jgi:DNA processing protein